MHWVFSAIINFNPNVKLFQFYFSSVWSCDWWHWPRCICPHRANWCLQGNHYTNRKHCDTQSIWTWVSFIEDLKIIILATFRFIQYSNILLVSMVFLLGFYQGNLWKPLMTYGKPLQYCTVLALKLLLSHLQSYAMRTLSYAWGAQ